MLWKRGQRITPRQGVVAHHQGRQGALTEVGHVAGVLEALVARPGHTASPLVRRIQTQHGHIHARPDNGGRYSLIGTVGAVVLAGKYQMPRSEVGLQGFAPVAGAWLRAPRTALRVHFVGPAVRRCRFAGSASTSSL
jgi:hypothetical protein